LPADVTGGKPVAMRSHPVSGVSVLNLLVAFCNIHRNKERTHFISLVLDWTGQFELLGRI
jgi:hypothetical protein